MWNQKKKEWNQNKKYFFIKVHFQKENIYRSLSFYQSSFLLISAFVSREEEVSVAIQFWAGSYINFVCFWQEGYIKEEKNEMYRIKEVELSVYILRLQGSWLITDVWGWRLAITALVLDSGTLSLAGMLAELLSSCCPLFRVDIQGTVFISVTSSPVIRNNP